MAKQRFAIGAEIDILGQEDLGAALAWWKRQSERPDVSYALATYTVNSSGILVPTQSDPAVIRVDSGQKVEILRAQLWDTSLTYTPASPLQTGWIGLYRNEISSGSPAFFFPGSGTTVLPAVWTNTDDCPRLWGGDRLVAYGTGLGDSNTMQVAITIMYRRWVLPSKRATLTTPSSN